MIAILICLILFSFNLAAEESIPVPLGLPQMPWPENNLYSKEKAELGRLLYFDKRLSSNNSVSCATCHTVADAFTDHLPVSTGIDGRKGTRNAPTVINSGYLKLLFWDGRAHSLEEQAEGPISNTNEMTLYSNSHEAHKQCAERISKIEGYRKLFKQIYGTEEISIHNVMSAIATFERTVLSGNSPYDRYNAGEVSAMSKEQIRGMYLFKKVGCVNCHVPPLFTDERFINIGIGLDKENPDLGRYAITKKKSEWGAFKVPTLREVENTYPYMHDGSLSTLEDVINYYNKGGFKNPNLHPLIKPLNLSEEDKQALISFLKALSGEGWQHIKTPSEFPK